MVRALYTITSSRVILSLSLSFSLTHANSIDWCSLWRAAVVYSGINWVSGVRALGWLAVYTQPNMIFFFPVYKRPPYGPEPYGRLTWFRLTFEKSLFSVDSSWLIRLSKVNVMCVYKYLHSCHWLCNTQVHLQSGLEVKYHVAKHFMKWLKLLWLGKKTT